MTPLPFRQVRAERLIAGGRLGLAAFSLLALALDPLEPARYAGLVKLLVAGFLVYGIARWRGAPLHAALRERFAIRSVLALVLDGEGAKGRLLALDKRRASPDNLALGEAVARQVEAELEQLYYVRRLQEAAAADERVRLARDLHDGVIQSLGGAALRLETARRILSEKPETAAGGNSSDRQLFSASRYISPPPAGRVRIRCKVPGVAFRPLR